MEETFNGKRPGRSIHHYFDHTAPGAREFNTGWILSYGYSPWSALFSRAATRVAYEHLRGVDGGVWATVMMARAGTQTAACVRLP